jgi:hypothetical protein
LVNGGGRKTDEYAANEEFLAAHPNVRVCEKNVRDFRNTLIEMGILLGFRKSLNLQVVNGGKINLREYINYEHNSTNSNK